MLVRTVSLLGILLLYCFPCRVYSQTVVPVQLYGLNYNTRKGADWNPNKCKTWEEVIRDLTVLRRLTSRLRILSLTDCGQGSIVLDVARTLGFQVWLGLWVSEDPSVFALEKATLENMIQSGTLSEYVAGDTILGITVGSEAIYREEVSVTELAQFTTQVKSLLATREDLATIPVAICDIAPVFNANMPALISPVDAVVINIFPFWENTPISGSMDRLLQQISPVTRYTIDVANKPILIGETGWPSDGFIEGVGVASPENARQYFVDFFCRMDRQEGWSYFYFTGIDNAWRQEQDPLNTIEGNWGIWDSNLQLKSHFSGFSFSCPSENDSIIYSFDEIDWTVPLLTVPPTTSPAPITSTSCQAHVGCQELAGNCCPADNGAFLACCNSAELSSAEPTPVSLPTTPPTSVPSLLPTSSPAAADKFPPSTKPTKLPSYAPVEKLTGIPAEMPSHSPSVSPTAMEFPFTSPVSSNQPTYIQSIIPTVLPNVLRKTETPNLSLQDTSIPTTQQSSLLTLDPSASHNQNDSVTSPFPGYGSDLLTWSPSSAEYQEKSDIPSMSPSTATAPSFPTELAGTSTSLGNSSPRSASKILTSSYIWTLGIMLWPI